MSDVVAHVRECHECTLGKPLPKPLAAPSGTTVGAYPYPFDVVYCDILSMAKTHDFVAGVKQGLQQADCFRRFFIPLD